MIIAYHAIFTTYGTWLPNDPRGSYSAEVYNRKLRELAQIRCRRQDPKPSRSLLEVFWNVARPKLARSPYFIDDRTRPLVAEGFRQVVNRLGVLLRACAIMNDHVHLVMDRGRHRIEYLWGQFKGAATRMLAMSRTPWTRGGWKVFLDDGDALRAAVAYVQANPVAAGMGPQEWDFVAPLLE